jgi:hypothetical protein
VRKGSRRNVRDFSRYKESIKDATLRFFKQAFAVVGLVDLI